MADSYGPLLLIEYSCRLEKVVTNSSQASSSSRTQRKWVYDMLFVMCCVFDVYILYICFFVYTIYMQYIYKIYIRYINFVRYVHVYI